MLVRVTQDDIDKGTPGIGDSCPVTLALQRATGDKRWRTSKTRFEHWENYRANQLIRVPLRVHRFIEKFDDKKPVKPFAFRFNPTN